MNSNICYNYTRFAEDNDTGHKVSYKFRLFYLSSKISWPFTADYYTNCAVLPTAFKLELMFQQVPLNGFVNIPYTLKRKDFLPRPVDAFFSVNISDANGRIIFQPLNSFGKVKMVSGESVTGNVTGLIMLGEHRNAFNEQIDAAIDVLVFFCHSGKIKSAGLVNTTLNVTVGSKKVT